MQKRGRAPVQGSSARRPAHHELSQGEPDPIVARMPGRAQVDGMTGGQRTADYASPIHAMRDAPTGRSPATSVRVRGPDLRDFPCGFVRRPGQLPGLEDLHFEFDAFVLVHVRVRHFQIPSLFLRRGNREIVQFHFWVMAAACFFLRSNGSRRNLVMGTAEHRTPGRG